MPTASHCLFLSPSSKRLLEQFKGRRASPIGVIEMVTGKGLAPRLEEADETTVGNWRRYQILQDVENAETLKGGGDKQVAIVKHPPSTRHDRHRATIALE